MILKASQRAGGKQLATHLLRQDENDHVEVHEIRGFAAEDLTGALREAYAISRGTKCTQYLFSVSFSPPQNQKVAVATFEAAIDEMEERVGLKGQPRVIVFHEKNGRRHAHCVWSRIKADEMRAVPLPHFKLKLKSLSRDLFIEHGWKMPPGLVKTEERNPLNFSRDEWQQAKRAKRDPAGITAVFQDCWAISDSANSFSHALDARGYYLARGDRRGYVAIDHFGEVFAIARWAELYTKDVAKRLGDPDDLPSIDDVKKRLAQEVETKLAKFAGEARREFEAARLGVHEQKRKLVSWQRDERSALRDLQAARGSAEARTRYDRFRRGLKGLWDRITGRHSAISRENEAEFIAHQRRDQAERQSLIDRQLAERRALQRQIAALQDRLEAELTQLRPSQDERRVRTKSEEAHSRRRRRTRRPSGSQPSLG